MDAIKKKMTKLSSETATATARANKFEDEAMLIGTYYSQCPILTNAADLNPSSKNRPL